MRNALMFRANSCLPHLSSSNKFNKKKIFLINNFNNKTKF